MLKRVLRWVLALAMVGAGANHFVNPDFYVQIMPPYLPWQNPRKRSPLYRRKRWSSGRRRLARRKRRRWP